MKKEIMDFIICPDCWNKNIAIDYIFDSVKESIDNATLKCKSCKQIFPIIDTILVLAPKELRDFNFELIQIKKLNNSKFLNYYKNLSLNITKDNNRIENKEMDFWNDIQYIKEPKKNWFRYLSRKEYLFNKISDNDKNILELWSWFWTDMFENIDKFLNVKNYISTDLSFNALKSIKEKNIKKWIKNLSLIVCVAWKPPFNKNVFDVIIALWILHHTPEMHNAICNIFEKIKNNWKFLLMEPRERKSILWKIFRKTFPFLWLKESEHELRIDFNKLRIEIVKFGIIINFYWETSPVVPLLWLTVMRDFWNTKEKSLFMQKIDRFMINSLWKLFPDTFGYWEWLFFCKKNIKNLN